MSAPADDATSPPAEPDAPQPPKVRGFIIWGLIGTVLVIVGVASLLMGRHTTSSGQSQGAATIKAVSYTHLTLPTIYSV